jgi:hypothetical protein
MRYKYSNREFEIFETLRKLNRRGVIESASEDEEDNLPMRAETQGVLGEVRKGSSLHSERLV